MKYLASLNENDCPTAGNFIKRNFYVDDGLNSVESVKEAIKLVREAQNINARGRLHLHKLCTKFFLIRETTDPKQWYYIDTDQNPADHASRGLNVVDLMSSTWLTGPNILPIQLDPVMEDGILRVGGRLNKASLPHDLKHPVILLREGVITRLILGYCHEKTPPR